MKLKNKIDSLTDDEAITSALLLGAVFNDPVFTWNGPHHYIKNTKHLAPSKDMPRRTKGDAARDYIRALTQAKP